MIAGPGAGVRGAIAGNPRSSRSARGHSARELADLTGVSKALISRIERGVDDLAGGDCQGRPPPARGGPYTEVDVDERPGAIELITELGGGSWLVPTVVLPDGSVLVNRSLQEIRDAITVR
ncbi:helix-turn-helix domain-containing protein [Nonomuraea sp. SBT364]|uniref:helix-turn-helix domain-containing protein n=1 Tax=Nonomuraea sp. SBT364 TaxID=1580530 RepID=UPI000AD603D5|nr:helix-turn-helix domain-containing protein [Nonomuraea sp. SBT364]